MKNAVIGIIILLVAPFCTASARGADVSQVECLTRARVLAGIAGNFRDHGVSKEALQSDMIAKNGSISAPALAMMDIAYLPELAQTSPKELYAMFLDRCLKLNAQ